MALPIIKRASLTKIMALGFLTTGLLACSGSDSTEPQDQRPTQVPLINQAKPFSGALIKVNQSAASRYIKNGIYSATANYGRMAPVLSENSFDAGFSQTTTQEAGVDEADRIEYDGETLYLAAYPDWSDTTASPAHVRIMQRNADFSLTETAQIGLLSENANINGLYLHDSHLAVLSENTVFMTFDSLVIDPWADANQKVSLDLYSSADPQQPQTLANIEFDGYLVSSRRIDNYVYLVTSYVAHVPGLNVNAVTEQEQLANYLRILDTPDDELMPKMYRNGVAQALYAAEDCAIPAAATAQDGYAQLVSVIRVNMEVPDDISASCVSTMADLLYMSKDNLYVVSTLDNQTVLHKIRLDASLSYQASGSVNGVIGWNGPRQLRLSEQDNYLRIVASDYTGSMPVHQLSVLTQQGNSLNVVATLPNRDAPEVLGKPGEDIYAVRFFGNRAYVVTFERIDPLYVIDIENPLSPTILGTLEIPGYSSYLHPMDNNFLLGVGQHVNRSDIPENGTVAFEPPTREGVKISLFDIADPSHPREVNSIVMAQSYTPVEYDYRALTVLNNDGHYQFAMPVEQWGLVKDEFDYWLPQSSLLLLDVDTSSASAQLSLTNQLKIRSDSDHYVFGGEDRSVIHGEHVFYAHGNQLWQSLWQENSPLIGPF
jgi:uncharacterized secreted protein with C-terminal beta-propeller domain